MKKRHKFLIRFAISLIVTFIFFILFSRFLLSATDASSSDLEVNFSSSPLFSESDGLWFPGRSLSKSFTVSNNHSSRQAVCLQLTRLDKTQKLSEAFLVQAFSGEKVYFDNGLKGFLGKELGLGEISAGLSKVYEIAVSLPEDTSEVYSNQQLELLVEVGRCVQEEEAAASSGLSTSSDSSETPPSNAAANESNSFSSANLPSSVPASTAFNNDLNRWVEKGDVDIFGEEVGAAVLGSEAVESDDLVPFPNQGVVNSLLQNNPNFGILLAEEVLLLGSAGYLLKRSNILPLVGKITKPVFKS